MTMPSTGRTVAVYGATGYTGRQIARELADAGVPLIVAGRSGDALRRLADDLPGDVEAVAVGLDDRAALEALLARVRTVVQAAGPFYETWEPVVRAAVATGTHYVDISGEQRAIQRIRDQYGNVARERGVALLRATAFYATLADLVVHLAAAGLGPVEDLDIAYDVRDWRPSGAAHANRLEGIGKPIVQWDRHEVTVTRIPPTRTVAFPDPRRVITYPAPEVLTIPRHVDVARLRTSMTTSSLTSRATGRYLPQLTRVVAKGLDSRFAPAVRAAFAWATGGRDQRTPDDPTSFTIVAHLRGKGTRRTATVTGRGIFDSTAPIVRRMVVETLAEDFAGRGFLAASEVVAPRRFLDDLTEAGVAFEISPRLAA